MVSVPPLSTVLLTHLHPDPAQDLLDDAGNIKGRSYRLRDLEETLKRA